MPRIRQIAVRFPQGGTVKTSPYEDADYSVTQLSKNIWPLDIQSSRVRGGPRPGLTTLAGSSAGAAYGWCRANYVTGTTPNFTTNRGVAIVGSSGSYTSLDGVTWTQQISTAVATNFASVAVYNNYIYQAQCASQSSVVRRKDLGSGAAAEDLTATAGTAPTGCGIVLSHQDRLVLAGNAELPHVHYWSATGNARDWLYSSRLSTGAFAATGSAGGQIGEPIIAALSVSDDRLLFGCRNSIYEVIGNPRTARVRRLSRNVGPINNKSWCLDDGNNVWMLTTGGPYRIDAANGSYPQPVGGKIPNDLTSVLAGSGDIASVGYDHRWNMIHFNVDPNSGSDVSWVYHIPSETWWSQTLSSSVGHLAVPFPELMTADKSALLLIGSNGAVYQFNRANTSEDFDNRLWLGPIRLGDDFHDGRLISLRAVLAKFTDLWTGAYTGNLNLRVYVGNSAETAFNSPVAFTCTAFDLEGANYAQNPMVRGNSAWFELYDSQNEKWLFEKLLLETLPAGKRQVA